LAVETELKLMYVKTALLIQTSPKASRWVSKRCSCLRVLSSLRGSMKNGWFWPI